MVKKLFKHEFVYYIRTLGIFLPWVLFLGILTRLALELDNGSIIMTLAKYSAIVVFAFAAFALILFSLAIGIVRFYKNMYSAEGYLTFSLPVTNLQHIFAKLTVASTVFFIGIFTVLISTSIAFYGAPLKWIVTGLQILYRGAPTVHAVFFTIEAVLFCLILLYSSPLLFYACISIGQMAKKNKILLSVAVYYLNNVITEIISTILLVIFGLLSETSLGEALLMQWDAHPFAMSHIFAVIVILVSAGISALYFFITYRMMSRKLNLE